jgi:hypothetical protein
MPLILNPRKEHSDESQVFPPGIIGNLQTTNDQVNIVPLGLIGFQAAPLSRDETSVRAGIPNHHFAQGGVAELEGLPRVNQVPNRRFCLSDDFVPEKPHVMVNRCRADT